MWACVRARLMNRPNDLVGKRVRIAYKDGEKVLFTNATLQTLDSSLVIFFSEHTGGLVAIPLTNLVKVEALSDGL
jgi:hypothetical protein